MIARGFSTLAVHDIKELPRSNKLIIVNLINKNDRVHWRTKKILTFRYCYKVIPPDEVYIRIFPNCKDNWNGKQKQELKRGLVDRKKVENKPGKDIERMPIIAQQAPVNFPKNVRGTTSPYPTVAIVIIDHFYREVDKKVLKSIQTHISTTNFPNAFWYRFYFMNFWLVLVTV